MRIRVSLALIPCKEIENSKKELIDDKGETIHIYNKNDGRDYIYIIQMMGMGLLGRSPITNSPINILTVHIVGLTKGGNWIG